VEDALLARLFVAGGLREELTRARNFYMLTTGSAPRAAPRHRESCNDRSPAHLDILIAVRLGGRLQRALSSPDQLQQTRNARAHDVAASVD
jgi:hypothetical protein